MKPKTPKLDITKLTPEQRDKLDSWNTGQSQLQTLEDIASMAQEMLGIMDDNQKDPGRKTLIIDHVTGDDFVKILQNMQDSLQAFKEQKEPTMPDYATPVVEAVNKLETALAASMKAKDTKPVVNVPAPNVNVAPTPVDFSGVERILKTDLPKAFKESIKLIPTVDIPEQDDTAVLEKLTEAITLLGDIDTGVRMKPQPGTMKVTNTDGTSIKTGLIPDEIMYGAIMSNGGTVIMPVVNGMAGWMLGYYGTYATGASLTMEASFDGGLTYSSVRMLQGASGILGYVVTIATVSNSTSYFTAEIPNGATHLQVRCSAWAAPTGAISIVMAQTAQRFSAAAVAQNITTVATLTNITNWGNIVDNAAFTDGTTRLSPGAYIYDEVAGTALTENDAAAARIDEKRAQINIIEDGTTRGRRATVNASGGLLVDLGAAGTSATSLGKAEDAVHANGDTGVAVLGVRDDTLNATSGAEGDYEMIHTTAEGAVWVAQTPSITGGWTTYHLASAGSTNATNIKASAGTVGGWFVYNSNAAARKLVFHNTAGTPTAGASVYFAITIPATSGANVEFGNGISFSTGIAITTVTGLADSDNTAVAANDLIINIWYK